MKTATIGQHENGIYTGEIRDEYGDIESAMTASTAAEVHQWAFEHCADSIILEANNGGNHVHMP